MCDFVKFVAALIGDLDNKDKFGQHWAISLKIRARNKLEIKHIVKAHDDVSVLQHGGVALTLIADINSHKVLLNGVQNI
jgi:predicted acyltransferase (DUF342 family)